MLLQSDQLGHALKPPSSTGQTVAAEPMSDRVGKPMDPTTPSSNQRSTLTAAG